MMLREAPTTLDPFIDWDDCPLLDEALQYAQNKDAKDPLGAKTKAYLERLEKDKSR